MPLCRSSSRRGVVCSTLWVLLSFPCANALQAFPVTEKRIVYGDLVPDAAFPSFVRVFSRRSGGGESACGGTLTAKREAITAAHCVGAGTVAVRVEHPASDSQAWAYGFRLAAGHDSRTLRRDLAILNLSRDFVDGSQFATVTPTDDLEGVALDVVGFGTTEDGRMSSTLRRARLTGVSHAACISIWGASNVHDDVCAHGLCTDEACTIRSDSCGGDSGGPLFLANTTRLVGVVSRGAADCGSASHPGIYAAIPSDLVWETSVVATGDAAVPTLAAATALVLLAQHV